MSNLSPHTLEVIDDILDGCETEHDRYHGYLNRTSWRVEADYAFLKRAVPSPRRTLDVGAIPPMLIGFMAHDGAKNLSVMDPHANRFESFFQRHGIEFAEGDLLAGNTPTQPEPFDLVCLCEVLEHLPGDIVRTLDQVSQWVEPGGYLYLTTPNLRSVSGAVGLFLRGSGLASKSREPIRKQFARAQGGYGYFGHIREYTEKEVRNLVEGMGYEHVATEFQVHPRAETFDARIIQALETLLPPFRLFGKYLFRKKG